MEEEVKKDTYWLRSEYLSQCKEKGWPDFAPHRCWGCNQDVMEENRERIIRGDGAGITGCSKCFKTFCD